MSNATITKTDTQFVKRNGVQDWPVTRFEITHDDGEIHVLDGRCVNMRAPQLGQRGTWKYRDYEFGSRKFFDGEIKKWIKFV